MHKVLASLVALVAATSGALSPALAQQAVASLETSRVVIAPPQNALARTIKDGLSAAYYSATRDTTAYNEAQRLYFLYGERHFDPIWLSQDASGAISFSPAAEKIVALFRTADTEGLRPSDYLTPDIDLSRAKSGDPAALAALETAFCAPPCAMPTISIMAASGRNRSAKTSTFSPKRSTRPPCLSVSPKATIPLRSWPNLSPSTLNSWR